MNMNNLLKQAQKMQADMAKAQDELANIKVQGSSGGGMVTVEANCKLEILSIKIEKEVVDPEDKEMLEDLVTAAVNQTIQTAQAKAQEEMQKITGGMLGGMNLPGNLNIPGM